MSERRHVSFKVHESPSQERSTYVPLLKLLYPTLRVSPILAGLSESPCHSISVDWVMYIPAPSPTESDASEDRSALSPLHALTHLEQDFGKLISVG